VDWVLDFAEMDSLIVEIFGPLKMPLESSVVGYGGMVRM